MADDRFEAREGGVRPLGTWTLLFRGFQVALDWKKLLLAAGGIVATAFSWWLLAVIFGGDKLPVWPTDYPTKDYKRGEDTEEIATKKAWEAFKSDRRQWNLRYEASGASDSVEYIDTGDLATTPEEFKFLSDGEWVNRAITRAKTSGHPEVVKILREDKQKKQTEEIPYEINGRPAVVDRKPTGRLRTWPWFEDRGPNPYLMVTGQAGRPDPDGTPRYAPWDRGHFFEWFTGKQLPVLLEPLAKFARPVIYLLKKDSGVRNYTYFFLVIVVTLAIWALFGGAITRMAAVQVARKEKISLTEAFRFAKGQWKSYLFAALFPLVIVAFFVVCCMVFWLICLIPVVGDLLGGLGWPLVLLAGAVMAAALVGYLVGWPLIQATISTEGSDSFDALSRTYSYVFQSPWNYLGYSSVALTYGAVVVFFIGFMGSLTVYLGLWGASKTPFSGPAYANRDPSYLFVYAPTSFGWRELLLQGATVDGARVVEQGEVQQKVYDKYVESFGFFNKVGAFLASIWIYLALLMIIGFAYSYFWSASTIIYLLMRHKVDDTDLDEVYLEEEEAEDIYTPPAPQEAPAPRPGTTPLTMVEPPALRPANPAPAPVPAPATPSATPEGNAPGVTGTSNP